MYEPLILSGPSGVGKSYIEKYLTQNYGFKRMLSTTTRPQRENEKNGIDYEFISEKAYKQYEAQGAFITSVHNLNAWYGIRKDLIDNIIKENKIPICIIVPQIIEQFVAAYPNTNAIFLKPEDTILLIERMRLRGDAEEKIKQRLDQTLIEINLYEKLKHLYKDCIIVTNDNFEENIKKLTSYYNF